MSAAHYDITKFKIVDHGVLHLRFEDGLEGEVDLRGHLWGPVFERVRTREEFREVYINNGTVSWPGGADLDPDTLYEKVRTGVGPDALPA
jgi:hypothetical protein